MKNYSFILLLSLLFTISCNDNLVDVGAGIQPSTDLITVASDTFHVASSNYFVESMYSKPDSFLLGSFYDETFGTTSASILAQVMCPIGYKFPPSTEIESANLVLFTKSWTGDANSPMDLNVYKMNKGTFAFSSSYKTDINPGLYADETIDNLIGRRILTASDTIDKVSNSKGFIIKLSDKFAQDFYAGRASYTSETTFTKFFGGLYLKTNFGTSTILNISDMELNLNYHYTAKINGVDSVLKSSVNFYANKEVRQVNLLSRPDAAEVKLKLNQKSDVNYLSAPANIHTSLKLPLAKMKRAMDLKINNSKKKIVLNYAIMQVEVADTSEAKYPQSFVKTVLLVKESEVYSVFRDSKLPLNSNAVVGSLKSYGTTAYYTFDLAKLLSEEIKKAGSNPLPEFLDMRLVPVSVDESGSIKQEVGLSSVIIRSGTNKTSPMRIKLIYSGF